MHGMVLALVIIDAARKARGGGNRLEEFGSDPMLTLAALALIVVSFAWLIVSRAIYRNLTRAEERSHIRVDKVRPPRDIWRAPPS